MKDVDRLALSDRSPRMGLIGRDQNNRVRIEDFGFSIDSQFERPLKKDEYLFVGVRVIGEKCPFVDVPIRNSHTLRMDKPSPCTRDDLSLS
jgi:hypothetical protein